MTDTPSTILLTREQSTGSNTNLWGLYLITTQRQTEQASKGTQSLAVTGDATISWTNYTTGNTGQCAVLRLTGALTAAATLTFPSYQNWMIVTSAAGATVTIKCSGGTGVAIPNNTIAYIFCDATDYYSAGPTTLPSYVSTLGNNGDVVVKATLESAIAGASGLTAPFILNSAADTTPGYLGQKLTTQVTGATTTQLSGLMSLQYSTVNSGGNEQRALVTSAPYVGGFINDGAKTSQYTPVFGHRATIDTSSGSFTINLSGMTTPQIDQSFKLTGIGGIDPFFLGTVNSTSNGTATLSGTQEFVYVGGTTGWSFAASSTMGLNFTDPYKFVPVSAIANSLKTWTSLTVTSGNNELVGDTSATFNQTIAGVGATLTQTFVANTYNTILNVTSTKAGEVTTIYGPIQNATGAQIIRITRDGGTPKTLTISVTAGYRACLLTGGIYSAATTPANLATGQFGANTARNTLDIASAASSAKIVSDFQTAKYYGTPLFEFSRSLLVEIQSTSNIASTGLFESTAGVVYRTLLAG